MRAKSNYIDPSQFQQMIQAIPRLNVRKWSDKDVEMIFKISYWLGLRMIETTRLKAEDFNLLLREVYLGLTKTKKEDYAAVPTPFIPELEEFLHGKKGALFPDCNSQIVRVWLTRLGIMLDIPALTTPQEVTGEKTKTHIFRKSIGKDLLYGTHGDKAPLNIISRTLRHESLDTTSKYLRAGNEDVKDWWSRGVKESDETTWKSKEKKPEDES